MDMGMWYVAGRRKRKRRRIAIDLLTLSGRLKGEHVPRISHWRDVRVRHCSELSEARLHADVSEANEGAFVAHLVAVVGRGEDSDALPIVLRFVAFVAHFMGANDELQVVLAQEGLGVVGAEAEAETSLAWSATSLWLRI